MFSPGGSHINKMYTAPPCAATSLKCNEIHLTGEVLLGNLKKTGTWCFYLLFLSSNPPTVYASIYCFKMCPSKCDIQAFKNGNYGNNLLSVY